MVLKLYWILIKLKSSLEIFIKSDLMLLEITQKIIFVKFSNFNQKQSRPSKIIFITCEKSRLPEIRGYQKVQ